MNCQIKIGFYPPPTYMRFRMIVSILIDKIVFSVGKTSIRKPHASHDPQLDVHLLIGICLAFAAPRTIARLFGCGLSSESQPVDL